MDKKFSEFRESDKCMNWAQFDDPLCCVCLAGAVVASWAQVQIIFLKYNIFVTEFSEFSKNI